MTVVVANVARQRRQLQVFFGKAVAPTFESSRLANLLFRLVDQGVPSAGKASMTLQPMLRTKAWNLRIGGLPLDVAIGQRVPISGS